MLVISFGWIALHANQEGQGPTQDPMETEKFWEERVNVPTFFVYLGKLAPRFALSQISSRFYDDFMKQYLEETKRPEDFIPDGFKEEFTEDVLQHYDSLSEEERDQRQKPARVMVGLYKILKQKLSALEKDAAESPGSGL